MRILAIRGCNLASLAGEFEIDLSRAPLGDAGVFAIVGNTGAGKSTLLDALCVALFDRTPRLTNHSRVVVGRGEDDPGALGAQDVRTLLRRGAATGWAEVDFESGDARRYRARWSVRRARGQTDGTLQDQQITLTAIDAGGTLGERLGGTKTETLKAISARLGLSFDQFRRSALLAQGEFAAFLRADGKDRSELLERMTGTEIYSRLSIAAHLKASLAEQRLREGRARAELIPVLADDVRAATEVELALAEQAKLAARARFAAAEAAARWRDEDSRRRAALAQAEAEHATALAAAASGEAERAELALRRRAEQLRPAWDEAARLDRAVAIATGEVGAADEATRTASAAHAVAVERRAGLATRHAPVRAARIAAGLVERTAGAAAGMRDDAEARVRDGRDAAAGMRDDAEARVRDARDAAAWIAARPALGAEVATWAELETRFAQHGALADTIASLDRTLGDHARTRTQLGRAREQVAADHKAAVAKLADAQRKATSFHGRRGLTLDAAKRQEDEARTRQVEVERLVSIAAGARGAITVRDQLDAQLAELDEHAAADAAQRARLEGERAIALSLRDERARIVEELRRAAGYEHARAELRDGEACPLCGATEHPWRDRGAFDELIGDAEARLAELVATLDGMRTALANLEARDQARGRERARIGRHRETAVESAQVAAGAWRDQLAALGELMLERDPSTREAERVAHELETAARQRLEQARAVFSQVQAATKAAQDAQADVQLQQAAVDQLQAGVTEHDRRIAELDATIERQHGERAGRVERRAELEGELVAAITRWREASPAMPRDLAGARGAMSELVAVWRSHAERVADADGRAVAALAVLDREVQATERAMAEHAARHEACVRRRDALVVELGEAATRLTTAREAAGFDADELRRLLAGEPARVDELAERIATLERAVDRTRAIGAERRRRVDDHAAAPPATLDDADRVPELATLVSEADAQAARLAAALAADVDARARREAALALLADVEAGAEIDRVLGAVIGSHDGKLFRSYAQSLTLDGLLAVANAHLEELAPRYQLERVPRHDLELQVIDRDLGAEVRSVQSLSGGESFLVSLALALGLSSMSAHDVRVRTLLIDEGFGTLDPATLDSALSVLDALQATGRQVGVISHVPALVERVGAHVRVVQRGGGRSEVIVA